MTRTATLSVPADQFQREGQGELKGLNDIVRETEGVSDVQWADEGDIATGTPLILEAVLAMVVAYLIGLGLGRVFFGRSKKESFLDRIREGMRTDITSVFEAYLIRIVIYL